MKIEKESTAALTYILTDAENGAKIEEAKADKPANFKFGINQLLPKFEENLIGLQEGDRFDFIIEAEDAYGPTDPYAIFDIPSDTFEEDGEIDEKMLQVGNIIPMTDDEGNKHMGKITSVNPDSVTMNFNHPLAGKDLSFIGKILSVNQTQ